MADLGLDRAERAPGGFGFAEDIPQGADFDHVADLGAGAVRFQQADAVRLYPGAIVGVQQRLLLARGAGGVDCIPLAVAGGTDPANDRIDLVSVALGVGQAL